MGGDARAADVVYVFIRAMPQAARGERLANNVRDNLGNQRGDGFPAPAGSVAKAGADVAVRTVDVNNRHFDIGDVVNLIPPRAFRQRNAGGHQFDIFNHGHFCAVHLIPSFMGSAGAAPAARAVNVWRPGIHAPPGRLPGWRHVLDRSRRPPHGRRLPAAGRWRRGRRRTAR